jgi:hypothetical protein
MTRVKGWIGVLCVFLLGAAAGSGTTLALCWKKLRRSLESAPGFQISAISSKLKTGLSLDSEQSQKLEIITSETRQELRQLHIQLQPQSAQIIQRAASRIREILRPDQAEKFDILRKRTQQAKLDRQKNAPLPSSAPVQ